MGGSCSKREVPAVPAEHMGHINLCCLQVIRHLSPFFDSQRGLESAQKQVLQLGMGKYPWIFAAPPDFEHTAQRGSARTLLTPLTTFHPPSYPSTVSHQAGKFSIVPTAVSLGTSVAFFGAVSTPETLFSFDPWLGICHFSVFPCLPGHEASLVPPASPEGTWSGRCQLR